MTSPLVSVIIPAFNAGRYVVRAVESALAQTYSPVEVIVVDDGSTDNTADVLKGYRSKIRYIYQTNASQAAARNRAIRESRGEYFAFLDADDLWFRDKLEQQMSVLLANPAVGLVHTDFDYLDEETGRMFTTSRPRHKLVGRCYSRLFFGNSIFASSVVVRRKCLDKVGWFDEQIPAGMEDYDLWLRISQQYEFAYVDRCLAVYRQHSANLSHNTLRMRNADLAVIRKALTVNPSLWQAAEKDQIKQRLFDLYFGVAYLHFDRGNFAEARRFLYQAVRVYPRSGYAWMLWLSSFLPGSWIWFLRNVKQRLSERPSLDEEPGKASPKETSAVSMTVELPSEFSSSKTFPLVSVIIPTFNAARYVVRAVESALAQTYSPVEVIVVNDGSTDDTTQVLEPFKSRIRYIYQHNRGLPAARNAGIQQARGEFFAFLDADDLWFRDKLEQQMPVLLANPAVGLVHTDFDYLDEETGRTFITSRPRHKLVGRCYSRLFFGNSIFASSVVVRRKCLDKVGWFDEQLISGMEDYDLWLRISQQYEFAYVDRCLAVYRQHSANMSHHTLRMRNADLAVIRKALTVTPSLWQAAEKDQIKQRLFDLYFGVAYLHFDRGNFAEARRFLYQAVRVYPRSGYAWMLWLSSFLPGSWIWFLRNVKQRLSLSIRSSIE